MVNFDRKTKKIDFVIKKKPGGGFSEWLFNSKIDGTRLDMIGPLGKATFYPAIAKNILCIAGGSGIAGMMSIFSRACQEKYFQQYQGSLFFGVRTMKDAFFLEELTKFKNAFPNSVKIVIALSDEDVPASAKNDWPALGFDKGFVHEVAGRHMQGKYQNIRAYLAGPPPAVDGALRMLIIQAKLTTDNICYDKFS
jgi:toluene monooxygenase electron transfer component